MPIGAKLALCAVRTLLFHSTTSPLPVHFTHCFLRVTTTGRDDDDPNGDLLCDACGCGYHVVCLPQPEQAAARRLARRANAGEATPDWFCPVCAPVHGAPQRSPSCASPTYWASSCASPTCSTSSAASMSRVSGRDGGPSAPSEAPLLARVRPPLQVAASGSPGPMRRGSSPTSLRSTSTEGSRAGQSPAARRRGSEPLIDLADAHERMIKPPVPQTSTRRYTPSPPTTEVIMRGLTTKCAEMELARRSRLSPTIFPLTITPDASPTEPTMSVKPW